MPALTLSVLPDSFAVARLAPGADLPGWAAGGSAMTSVTRTSAELSIVVDDTAVPDGVTVERGWRALLLDGPIPFELTGVLAAVLAPLADASVPIFAISSYDTDHVLVPGARLEAAVAALRDAGHTVDDR